MNLITHPSVQKFCNRIKFYNFNTKAKVCGLDVKQDYERFKLYVELDHIPSFNILREFLCEEGAEKFLYYSKYWDSNRSSSLALGIKVDSKGDVFDYFHIKFKDDYQEILYKENLTFLNLLRINLDSLKKGISCEFQTKDKSWNKFYVYVQEKEQIAKIMHLKHKDIQININEIEELEIYCTPNKYKINIVNKMYNFDTKQNVWQTIPKIFVEQVQKYSTLLQTEPVYTGFTKDNICSVYFSLTNKPHNVLKL